MVVFTPIAPLERLHSCRCFLSARPSTGRTSTHPPTCPPTPPHPSPIRGLGDLEQLVRLRDNGFAEQSIDGGWRFTLHGVQLLQFAVRLADATPVFQPHRDLPLSDRTLWELQVALKEDGWSWAPWITPSSRTQKSQRENFIPESYRIGEKKVWFSGKGLPSAAYLMCLLKAPDLLEQGLEVIPHGLAVRMYQRFLAGDFGDCAFVKRPRLALQLDVEFDLVEDREVVEQDFFLGSEEDMVPAGADATEEDEWIRGLEEQLFQHDEELFQAHFERPDKAVDPAASEHHPAATGSGDPLGSVHAIEPHVPPPAEETPKEVGRDEAHEKPSDAIVTVGQESGPDAEDERAPAEVLRSGYWGVCRVTAIQPNKGYPHGAWQARCPFHALNERTDCKKESRVEGPEKRHRGQALRRLLHWCTLHSKHTLQRSHRVDFPHIVECPPWPVIISRKPTVAPSRRDVVTDAEWWSQSLCMGMVSIAERWPQSL